MFSFGCLALAIAGMTVCYSGDMQGNIKLTCSDVSIQGMETCKDQMARIGINMSSTSMVTTVIVPRGTSGNQ